MQNYVREIRWGIIFTAGILLWTWAEQLAGLHSEHITEHATYTNFFAIPAILIYVLALRQKRQCDFNDVMSWYQGTLTGLRVTLVVVLLSPAAQWITHSFISPDFFINMQAYVINKKLMSVEQALSYFSLKNYLLQSIVGAAVMGLVTSVIVAFFLRSKSLQQ